MNRDPNLREEVGGENVTPSSARDLPSKLSQHMRCLYSQ